MRSGSPLRARWADAGLEPTINTPIEAAAAALATAVDLPMTATGEETLTLVRGLAQIARHLNRPEIHYRGADPCETTGARGSGSADPRPGSSDRPAGAALWERPAGVEAG